jgi:hypothetical protein
VTGSLQFSSLRFLSDPNLHLYSNSHYPDQNRDVVSSENLFRFFVPVHYIADQPWAEVSVLFLGVFANFLLSSDVLRSRAMLIGAVIDVENLFRRMV